jgi:hypothetical protein
MQLRTELTGLTRKILITGIVTMTISTGTASVSAAQHSEPKVVVTYSENKGLVRVDTSAAGIDHGDLFHREDAISSKLNGPVIGVSYSQAEVISHNPEANTDVRRVLIQILLPKGRMYFTGISELGRGSLPAPGWTNVYAILGGTGIYAGARGTMTTRLLPDGKNWKSTARYTLD